MKTSPVAKKFLRLRRWLSTPLFWDRLMGWCEERAELARKKLGAMQKSWRKWGRALPNPTFRPTFEMLELRYLPTTTHFAIIAPATVNTNSAFTVTVEAETVSNTIDTGYTGTVQFATSDINPGVVVPTSGSGTYTFVSGDSGSHTFTNLFTLVNGGPETISVTDSVTASITGTATLNVLGSINAFVRGEDPQQSEMVPIGNALVMPGSGSLMVSHGLNLNVTPGTPVLGGDPALVYNAGDVNVKPIVEAVYSTNPSGAVPDYLLAALDWGQTGTYSAWTTFTTTGHSAGDTYDLALQAPTVTTSGDYLFNMEVEAYYSGVPTLYTYTGIYATATQAWTGTGANIVVEDSSNPLGAGWSLAGVDSLVTSSAGALLVDGATGTGRFFRANGGSFISPPNDFGSLTLTGSTYTYTGTDGTTWNFNSGGQLVSIVERNTTLERSFSYSGVKLTGITDLDGSVATFTYSGSNLSTIAAPGSRTTTLSINGSGNLASITNPDGGVESFTYDGNHKLTVDQFAPLGPVTYSYSAAGLLTGIALDSSSDWTISAAAAPGLATSPAANYSSAAAVLTDPRGNVSTYVLDTLSRLTELETPNGGAGLLSETWNLYPRTGLVHTDTDPRGNTTAYAYDSLSDLTAIYFPDGTHVTSLYDAHGNLTSTTDQNGNTTAFQYDSYNDLTVIIDAKSNRTTNTYYTSVNVTDLLDSTENALGNYTTYTYSSKRQLLTVQDPLNAITTYSYDGAGNMTVSTDPLGHVVTTAYDAMGRVTSVTQTGSIISKTYYNYVGLVTETVDPNGNIAYYGYDAQGDPITTVQAAGTSVHATSSNQFDPAGNLIATTDPLGHVTRYYYDNLNRATASVAAVNTNEPTTTTISYDADDNVTATGTEVTSTESSFSQASGSPISAGTSPYVIGSGDFNNDGNDDLIVASYTSGSFSILLSNGNGTFRTGASYSIPNTDVYSQPAVGDLNGDGKLDIVMPDNTGSLVSVYLGNGDGTFGAPTNYSVGNHEIDNVALGDFNNDGKPDLAVSWYNGSNVGSVGILLGTGNGTFGSATNFSVGSDPYGIAMGDFNGDGNLDLATANFHDNTVSVLMGCGNGSFGPATNYSVGSTPEALAVGDFNLDGKQDLAVTINGASTISTLLGNGNGTFQSAINTTVAGNPLPLSSLGVVGQTNLGLVATNELTSGVVSVLLGNGNGAFTTGQTISVGTNPDSIAVGDFNGDGAADIAVANTGSNTVSIYVQQLTTTSVTASFTYDTLNRQVTSTDPLSNTTTTLYDAAGNVTEVQAPLSRNTTYEVDALDRTSVTIDPTGATTTLLFDALSQTTQMTDANGNITRYSYNADGAQTSMTTGYGTSLAGTSKSYFDPAGNLTQTSDPLGNVTRNYYDALNRLTQTITGYGTTAPSTTTDYLDSNGNITETAANVTSVGTSFSLAGGGPFGVGGNPFGIAAADFNGDGKADLVMTYNGTNNIGILLGNGDGSFAAGNSYAVGTDPLAVVTGDFNGDGFADLAVANTSSNSISVFLGNGNGTFASAGSYAVGSSNHVNDIIAADFNGDGILDLAVTCAPSSGAGYVEVLLGNGNGTFQGANSFATGNGPIGLAAADLNADGKPDLVVAASTSGKVSVLLGNGDGSFGMANNFTSGGVPNQVVVQDFNNDGKPDIAVDDATTNIIGVLLGNGDGTFQSRINSSVGSYPYPLSGMAVIGQSNTDLVVGDQISESVIILTSNGDGSFATAQTFSFPAVPSAIAVGDFTGNGAMDLAVTDHGSSEVSVLMQQLTTTSVTMTYSFDALNRQAASTDANGNTTTTVYDADSDVIATENPLSQVGTTVYDAKNQPIVGIDPTGAVVTTLYDLRGLATEITDADGNNTTYSYDSDGQVLATTEGAATTYALTRTSTYDADGDALTSTDGAGSVTSYLYDKDGRVTETIFPAASYLNTTSTVTSLYDGLGNLTDQTDQNGTRTTFAYNAVNQQSGMTVGVGSGTTNSTANYYDLNGNMTGVSTNGQLTQNFFDAKGQLTLVIDPTGKRTAYSYDLRGLQTSVADPTQYTYDNAGHLLTTTTGSGSALVTTTNFYNTAGELTGTEDGLNDLTTNYYDPDGRITETVTPTGGSNSTTYYQFDKAGNLTEETDPDGNITTFTYDSLNRVSSKTTIMGTQAYTAQTTFAYNTIGLLASETDPLGRREDFLYDKLGRVTSQKWYDASSNLTQTFTSTYDLAGNLITATSDAGTYTMTYNALKQVTQVAEPFTASLSFTYDSSGNRNVMQERVGGTLVGTVTTLYDGANRLTESLISTSSGAEAEVDLDYNETNGLIDTESRYSYPSATRTFAGATGFVYDAANRVGEIDYYTGSHSTLATIGYAYDGADRLSAELDNGTTVATYSYDGTGQLTKDGAVTYTYDAAGNRTVGGTYTYSTAAAGNELTYDGVWTYTYDKAGNITQKVDAAGDTWTYGYNNANKMTTAKEVNGGTTLVQATYTYDYFGNMIEEVSTVSGTTTTQMHNIDQWNPANTTSEVWADMNGSNAITTQYQRGDQVDQIFASISSGGTLTFQLTDHLGSTRYITDSTGNTVLDTIVYDAWGNITSGTATGEYLWAGYMLDSATGLYYDRARFYDPKTGRWTTQDPIGLTAGSPNISEYIGNGPTNATDPTGNFILFNDRNKAQSFANTLNVGQSDIDASVGTTSVGGVGYYRIVANPETAEAITWSAQPDSWYNQAESDCITSPTQNLLGGVTGAPQGLALMDGTELGPSNDPYAPESVELTAGDVPGFAAGLGCGLVKAEVQKAIALPLAIGQLALNPVGTISGMYNSMVDLGQSILTFDLAGVAKHILPNTFNLVTHWADPPSQLSWFNKGVSAGEAVAEIVNVATGAAGLATTLAAGTRSFTQMVQSRLRDGCFGAGTHLRTPGGSKPIEEFEPGDWVLSSPEFGGHNEVHPRRVVLTFKRLAKVIELKVGGHAIETTPEHPFWVRAKGWVPAKDLEKGNQLWSHDGQWLDVDGLPNFDEYATVYNLEVDEDHTYFVGEVSWGFSVWAHNATGLCGGAVSPVPTAGWIPQTRAAPNSATSGPRGPVGTSAPNNLNWNWRSRPTFGHTFNRHGAGEKNTRNLGGRAGGTGESQGQWLNNDAAANFLQQQRPGLTGPTIANLPPSVPAQVIKPNGTSVPATRAQLVPNPSGGYSTAYPIE